MSDAEYAPRLVFGLVALFLFFWGGGYLSHKLARSGLIPAPLWLWILCGMPRRDRKLEATGIASQMLAYSLVLAILTGRRFLPEDARLWLIAATILIVPTVVYLLLRLFYGRGS